jgi:hypothetical protein
MSHHDETPGAPGARSLEPDDGRLQDAARATLAADREAAELRRSLLIYGTAGQAGRVRVEVGATQGS